MPQPLSKRISAAILISFTGITILFAALGISMQQQWSNAHLETVCMVLDTIVKRENSALANEIFAKRKEALSIRLAHLITINNIVSATLYDKNGIQLTKTRRNALDARLEQEKLVYDDMQGRELGYTFRNFDSHLIFAAPITAVGEIFGWIELTYDLRQFNNQIDYFYLFFGSLILILYVGMFTLLRRLLNQTVIHPLGVIGNTIRHFEPGAPIPEIPAFKDSVEFSDLVESFSEMAARLEASHAETTLTHKELRDSLEASARNAKALAESEARFRAIFDQAPIGIIIFGNDSVILSTNEYFADIMGARNTDDIVGINMLEEVKAKNVRDTVFAALRMNEATYEGYYNSISGNRSVYIRVRLRRITDQILLGVFEDLTNYKHVLTALEQNEERYRIVVDNLSEMVVVLVDNKIAFANAACEIKLKTPLQDLLGQNILRYIDSDHRLIFETALAPISPYRSIADSHVTRTVSADGDQRWMYISASRIVWENKSAFICIFNDVDDRIKAEEELETLNKSLEATVEERTRDIQIQAEELEKANIRLRELDSLKTSFLSSVSHELRTPLTSILGFAKITEKQFDKHFAPLALEKGILQKRGITISDNLTIIIKEGERLSRLVNDVLDLARIESGHMPWKDALVNVPNVVREVARMVAPDFQSAHDLRLEIVTDGEIPPVYMDSDKLMQVLRNLLHNATKFTTHGTVRIRLSKLNGASQFVEIKVEDNGPGIPDDEKDRIFDRFYQATTDTDKDKPHGSGLGLAISQQIVEHYGGTIHVEDTYPRGSAFVFTIPVYKDDYKTV